MEIICGLDGSAADVKEREIQMSKVQPSTFKFFLENTWDLANLIKLLCAKWEILIRKEKSHEVPESEEDCDCHGLLPSHGLPEKGPSAC